MRNTLPRASLVAPQTRRVMCAGGQCGPHAQAGVATETGAATDIGVATQRQGRRTAAQAAAACRDKCLATSSMHTIVACSQYVVYTA